MTEAESLAAKLESLEKILGYDRTVEVVAGNDLELLLLAIGKRPYTAQKADTMLTIYDALQGVKGAEQQSLEYGIKAVALLRQNAAELPTAMLSLKAPAILVEYTAVTASDLELELLMQAFHSKLIEKYRGGFEAADADRAKMLAKQLITLSGYVIGRTGEATYSELTGRLISGQTDASAVNAVIEKRVNAYHAIALACQALDDLEGAVHTLVECNRYTGQDVIKGLSDEVKEAYFSRKFSLHTPSTGKVPEHLKVHPGEFAFAATELMWWRLRNFGFKKGEGGREGPVQQAKGEKPVDYRDEDFALVGVTREMDWITAHKTYIGRMQGESAVFNNPLAPAQDVARVAAINTAWDMIKDYFLQKEAERVQSAR